MNADPPTWNMAFRSSTFYFLLANSIFYWLVVVVQTVGDYSNKLRRIERKTADTERQLALAKMEVLRMQMQPHFLFNALNSVAALIRIDQRQQAITAITKLSEMLRTSLDQNDSATAPLQDELDIVEKYVELEQIRFGERLRFQVDVDDQAAEKMVPRWILQPLVENAIRHGIESDLDAGKIDLSAKLDGHKMMIVVRDDGMGVSSNTDERIGLGNTRQRLQDLFGSEFRFEIIELEKGCCVQVEFPVQQNGNAS